MTDASKTSQNRTLRATKVPKGTKPGEDDMSPQDNASSPRKPRQTPINDIPDSNLEPLPQPDPAPEASTAPGDEEWNVLEEPATELPSKEAPVDGIVGEPRLLADDQDPKAMERLARREEKARRRATREEAELLKQQARDLLKQSRAHEKKEHLHTRHMDRVSALAEELGYDPERPVTEIPPLPESHEEIEMITVEEDQAYIRVSFDTETNAHLYEVIEPELTANETKIFDFLRDTMVRTLDGRTGEKDWNLYLRDAVRDAIVDHDILVDHTSTERIVYHLVRDFLGYGPIDVLLRDSNLEDISCDGPGIPIYIFHRNYESIRTNVVFDEETEMDSFVIRLAQRSGKHISIADPLLDATLPDGSRLQATLSREVTSRGSSFTIRKFREEPFTPPDLIRLGTVSAEMGAYFWFLLEEGRSLIYAGGTASGKTTSLNAVCQFIPPEKKIVSIEDTREINLLHENWIAGITRSGFGGELVGGKPAGTIDMYRLLEAALRQRPEYLIVGEVRGHEALTLFQAMATGHAVYSTMHADSVKSAVYRLENEPINVPRMMLQTLDTVAIQSQVRIGDKMSRRVKEVVEIVGFDPDTDDLLTNTTFYWDNNSDRHVFTGHSSVFEQIRLKKGWSPARLREEWDRRIRVLDWLHEHDVHDFREVTRVVREYYRRPDKLMGRIAAGEDPSGPGWIRHTLDDGTKPLPDGVEPDRIGITDSVHKENMPGADRARRVTHGPLRGADADVARRAAEADPQAEPASLPEDTEGGDSSSTTPGAEART